ncbi:MAG: hypothetical protein PHG32_04730 [Candidatus Cloacimonetes bacterium]|nr:hypothetical protein [Candidatus Cloacimonadota bacterium]
MLTIRYLTEIRKRRGGAEKIWEQILTRFGAEEKSIWLIPLTAW